MADPKHPKSGSRPSGSDPWPDPSTSTGRDRFDGLLDDEDPATGQAGHIVHDERGNAVWNWRQGQGANRTSLDSTSGLLKRLEVPYMKVDDTAKDLLKVESDRDPGGGYDPYGTTSPSKPSKGLAGKGTGPAFGRGTSGQGAPSSPTGKRDTGGGYDPYGKGATR